MNQLRERVAFTWRTQYDWYDAQSEWILDM